MEIIRAEESHILNIQTLAHQTWPAAYGNILKAEQIEYMLQLFYSEAALKGQMKDGQVFFLAKDGNRYIGFASMQMKDEEVARLQKLYVLPDLQKQSTGKKLLLHVIESAREQGAQKIELNVNRYNPAITFYEKYGFSILRTEDIDIGGGFFMNDYIMCRTL